MTSTRIVEHLAHEFSVDAPSVLALLEMIDAGLQAPFIGRARRATTGCLSEGQIRRLARARTELEELDRRRGTILRMLGAEGGEPTEPADGEATLGKGPAEKAPASVIEAVRTCMDRFELEDLFLPYRRPEPEVQLALDRGLGRLADELVTALPPERRAALEAETPEPEAGAESEGEADSQEPAAEAEAGAEDESGAEEHAADEAAAQEAQAAEGDSSDESADARSEEPEESFGAPQAAPGREEELLHGQIELTPALARLCAPFVSPDRGVHTETEALSGAVRILSDRLGRDTRLRGMLRRMLRKQGVLSVRVVADESKLGRHKSLLRLRQPLRQIQGHRLLALRQAQKERVLQMPITLERVAR